MLHFLYPPEVEKPSSCYSKYCLVRHGFDFAPDRYKSAVKSETGAKSKIESLEVHLYFYPQMILRNLKFATNSHCNSRCWTPHSFKSIFKYALLYAQYFPNLVKKSEWKFISLNQFTMMRMSNRIKKWLILAVNRRRMTNIIKILLLMMKSNACTSSCFVSSAIDSVREVKKAVFCFIILSLYIFDLCKQSAFNFDIYRYQLFYSFIKYFHSVWISLF